MFQVPTKGLYQPQVVYDSEYEYFQKMQDSRKFPRVSRVLQSSFFPNFGQFFFTPSGIIKCGTQDSVSGFEALTISLV